MNKRIKELRRQATLVETYTSHDGSVHEGKSVDLEKFAELIVKECAMLVEGFEITQEVALDEYVDFEASTVLKEHFGV